MVKRPWTSCYPHVCASVQDSGNWWHAPLGIRPSLLQGVMALVIRQLQT